MLSTLLSHGHDIRTLTLPKGSAPLHCMAASAGYEQRTQEIYTWDGKSRGSAPFLVIQHTILGEGRLDYAGASHRLTPGQTMLVTVPHDHRYWLDRGGHWEYFWLVLHGREALRLAREILDAAGPVLRIAAPEIDRLASACHALITSVHPTPGAASTAAYAAMAALHDGVFGARPTTETPPPPAFARVVDYVQHNLASPLHIDRLAAIAGQSRAHFVRQFTAHVGMPPSDFVHARRMDRVERLLLATEMKVSDIAQATGFADRIYLAKAFRRKNGLSPLGFRATRVESP